MPLEPTRGLYIQLPLQASPMEIFKYFFLNNVLWNISNSNLLLNNIFPAPIITAGNGLKLYNIYIVN